MKIENGFVTGREWHTKRVVMINIQAIERIDINVGHSPPADRVRLLDPRAQPIDLLQDMAV